MSENEEKDIIKSPEENSTNYEEVQSFQEVEIEKKPIRTDSYFDGGLLELIGWRILAFLITAVTLGIAYPWAQCMLYSWQFKHTVYNGKRLKFEGTGGELFVNIFKWIFFSIITLGIYILVIPVRKTRWVISNLHYEDEQLVTGESFFDGKTLHLIGINILSKLLIILSLGLLYSFTVCLKLRWINRHTVINRKKVVFTGKALNLWGKYLLWAFLSLITFGVFALWIPIKMLKWQTKNTHIKTVGEIEEKDKSALIIIPIIIIIMIIAGMLISTIINNTNFNLKKIPQIFNFNRRIDEENKNTGMIIAENYTNSKISTTTNTTTDKNHITVGGYTLKYGTYKGIESNYDWEEQKEINREIILVLSSDKIRFDGQLLSYSISGNKIIANGFAMFQVNRNNEITLLAGMCPELTYQGY